MNGKGTESTSVPLVTFVFSVMSLMAILVTIIVVTDARADEVADDTVRHGFDAVAKGGLSPGLQLQGNNNSIRIEPALVTDDSDWSENTPLVMPWVAPADAGFDNLDSVAASYQSDGFRVSNIAAWKTDSGILTVGNDWTSFQDVLSINKEFDSADIDDKNRTVVSQIKWFSANGFSISLEDAPETRLYLTDDTTSNTHSPSLILSWQGGPGGAAGEYRVTAMGRKLDVTAEGQKFDSSNLTGWGLNMEGGWQIDDLFATLAVTFGNGIDSYILQKYGNDLVVTPNYDESSEPGGSLSIRPSLYYRLNNNSNFHVSLGHYSSEKSFNNSGIETLDTINMGYSWSPWPSTQLGVELAGQNSGGRGGVTKNSTQVKFDAKKRF